MSRTVIGDYWPTVAQRVVSNRFLEELELPDGTRIYGIRLGLAPGTMAIRIRARIHIRRTYSNSIINSVFALSPPYSIVLFLMKDGEYALFDPPGYDVVEFHFRYHKFLEKPEVPAVVVAGAKEVFVGIPQGLKLTLEHVVGSFVMEAWVEGILIKQPKAAERFEHAGIVFNLLG